MTATKESIMAAAMRLFAEKGLKLVTVREICMAARVNVALINYHFHNKNGLYQACVERLFRENTGDELCAIDATVSDARSWRAAVRKWIFGFSRVLRSTKGGSALAAGFFRQEVVHPSPMSDLVRERYVIPVRNCLLRLIAMAVEDIHEQRRWVESIWAQLSSYALVDALWHPVFRPVDAAVDAWADSIADFVYRQVMSGMKYRTKRGGR
ncbi:MAG: TetR family transcriptional regulator [Kiritimatiellae bacterium]|nr:TetR family transcriptional regulator [Kiritimatiellia bacterium]